MSSPTPTATTNVQPMLHAVERVEASTKDNPIRPVMNMIRRIFLALAVVVACVILAAYISWLKQPSSQSSIASSTKEQVEEASNTSNTNGCLKERFPVNGETIVKATDHMLARTNVVVRGKGTLRVTIGSGSYPFGGNYPLPPFKTSDLRDGFIVTGKGSATIESCN